MDMKTISGIFLSLLLAGAPQAWASERAGVQPEQARGSVVTGQVTDEQGQPLLGVTVTERGTTNTTVTDSEGRYRLRLRGGERAQLTFSYIGMTAQTLPAGRATARVALREDAASLQDVVVVGAYGTMQKRSDLVGSAYQVSAEQLRGLPQQGVDRMLDGLIPGVKVDVNATDAGRSRYQVRVRGEASLNASNEPLWIVDGVPMYTGEKTGQMPGASYTVSPLTYLNPDDIESMTVLKDATATSIYGADGANGVILITTKKGRQGKMRLRANVQYGIASIDRSTSPKVMNAEQWMAAAKRAYANTGQDMRFFPYQDNEMNQYSTTDTDWKDVFYDTGTTFLTSLSANGGSQRADYYVSGQYYQNDKTVKGNKQQRLTLNSNVNLQLHKRVKLGVDLSASYNNNDIFAMGRSINELLPIYSPYNADGTPRLYNRVVAKDDEGNPVWVNRKFTTNLVPERDQNVNNQKTWYLHTNFTLKCDILDGLTYTGQFGYDYQSTLEQTYSSQKNWTGMDTDGTPVGYSTRASGDYTNWTTIHRLNYNHTWGRHTVSALAGFEAGSRDYTLMNVSGSGFINDYIRDVEQASVKRGSNSSSTRRKASFLAQASYSYDHRYYLTVNGRKDGNSQFGSDVRWANFASVGVSWNIHNEKFFRIPWVNVLKLKASYGANGNSRIGSLESLGTYKFSDTKTYDGQAGGQQSQSPNSRLSWETTYLTNVGLRVAVLERIDLEVEYYHNQTKNLLSELPVSLLTGDTRVYRNIGEIVNKGVEVTLTTRNFVAKREGGFSWTTDLNLAHNSNKLTKSYQGTQANFGDGISWMEGEDTKTYYLVRWAGVDPYDGRPMWYDADGNITRTYDAVNNRVRGKRQSPTVTGGMTNTLSYRGFSLRFLLNYQFGGYAYSTQASSLMSDGYSILTSNQAVDQAVCWQTPGDIAANPAPLAGVTTGSSRQSTRFLYKKDLIRLQNLVLGYQLPKHLVKGWGLSDASISLIGDNLLVYSPYSHSDRNSYKTLMNVYPMERTFTLSLNVGF